MIDSPTSLHFVLGEPKRDTETIGWLVDKFAERSPSLFQDWVQLEAGPFVYDPDSEINPFHHIAEDVFAFLADTCTFDSPATPSALWLQMKDLVSKRAKA